MALQGPQVLGGEGPGLGLRQIDHLVGGREVGTRDRAAPAIPPEGLVSHPPQGQTPQPQAQAQPRASSPTAQAPRLVHGPSLSKPWMPRQKPHGQHMPPEWPPPSLQGGLHLIETLPSHSCVRGCSLQVLTRQPPSPPSVTHWELQVWSQQFAPRRAEDKQVSSPSGQDWPLPTECASELTTSLPAHRDQVYCGCRCHPAPDRDSNLEGGRVPSTAPEGSTSLTLDRSRRNDLASSTSRLQGEKATEETGRSRRPQGLRGCCEWTPRGPHVNKGRACGSRHVEALASELLECSCMN